MAISIHSDSESDDQNKEPLEDDREVLKEEEEREKLLTTPDARREASGYAERRGKRRSRRREKKKGKRHGKDYEMEAGGGDDASNASSRSSIESSRERETPFSRARQLRIKVLHITLTSVTIALVLSLLVLGAFRMSEKSSTQRKKVTALLSNGTSNFTPTTILVSLDGFRADFLNRGLTPTLNSFIAGGVSPKYMLPSFPSVTFPNHYTLITGLYPESHGIVGNSFWDPDLKEEFYYTDPARSMQPKWWKEAEPLWVTAAKQDVKSAIHMWPGSEAHIQIEPAFLDKYNGTEVLSRKVDRILQFLDLPSERDPGVTSTMGSRPQFIAFYVPNVDVDGHLYGPNSTEIRTTINNVDTMLHDLFNGLQERNLTDIVNVVVVSDHGMATTSIDRVIQLDDLIDPSLFWPSDGWPLHGLRPRDPTMDLRAVYDKLTTFSAANPAFDVYLRDENMPAKYHFTNNKRIAPLWIVPRAGWAIVQKEKFDVATARKSGRVYRPRGLHGYDHEHPLMRAIFVARGPAFPHLPNSKLEVFQNLEVYNIVCDSLGITPNPNNGTLRLPLNPIGQHNPSLASDEDNFADPPLSSPSPPSPPHPPSSPSPPSTPSPPSPPTSPSPPSTITTTAPFSSPIGVDDGTDGAPGKDQSDTDEEGASDWWQYLVDKVEQAKAWAAGLFASDEGADEDVEDPRVD